MTREESLFVYVAVDLAGSDFPIRVWSCADILFNDHAAPGWSWGHPSRSNDPRAYLSKLERLSNIKRYGKVVARLNVAGTSSFLPNSNWEITQIFRMALTRTLPASWFCSTPLYQVERRAVFLKVRTTPLLQNEMLTNITVMASLGPSHSLSRSFQACDIWNCTSNSHCPEQKSWNRWR